MNSNDIIIVITLCTQNLFVYKVVYLFEKLSKLRVTRMELIYKMYFTSRVKYIIVMMSSIHNIYVCVLGQFV